MHREQLQLHGGQDGFVDENTVRSVMARPQVTAQYNPDADLADLAAHYMFGFATTTQGFMDGNKRTALTAAERFLRKNHWRSLLSPKVMYLVAMAVARSELDRDALAEIPRDHVIE